MSIRELAIEVARLGNEEGLDPTDAVERVGLDPDDDVVSEDSSAFTLDEDDNDVVDFLSDDPYVHYILRRSGRRGNKTPWELVEQRTGGDDPLWVNFRDRVDSVKPLDDGMIESVLESHLRSDTDDRWMSIAVIAFRRALAEGKVTSA
jgi:hypothetical protein